MIKDYFKFITAAALLAVVLGVNAAVAAAATDGSSVIISQVLYDPAGTESGGEAVELYNPAASSINISGWVLATETSPTDATLPLSAVICSGCYYLVADVNWSNAKDNASWPNADHEEAITLANTDAGVALKDSNSTMIDAVGWGNPVSIGTGLFEGAPHGGSGNGKALVRKTSGSSYLDTDNNSNDFYGATPQFHSSNSTPSNAATGGAEVRVTIVVSGSASAVESVSITDDDSFLSGSQVSPVPGGSKAVTVEAVVSDANGVADIASVIATFNALNFTMSKKADMNSTAAVYSASFNLSSSFPAGNYTVSVAAIDNSQLSSAMAASFEYMTLVSVNVDITSLVFFASPGSVYESAAASGSQNATVTNVTIGNAGNVVLDFDVSATNFTSGSALIEAPRLQYAFGGNYSDAARAGNLTNSKARKDVNLAPDSKTGLGLRLNVPVATSPGNYTGIISLVAVNS